MLGTNDKRSTHNSTEDLTSVFLMQLLTLAIVYLDFTQSTDI